MNLATVTVRNFRSFITDQGHSTPSLDLGDGLNILVGPNNCGKSNLLRAIALALEDSGGSRFDPKQDIPHQLSWAYPHITLSLRCEGKTAVEKTLVRFIHEYEKSAGASKTYAEDGQINLRVVYRTNIRDTSFVVKGAPNKKGDAAKLEKAFTQFWKCVRFIYLRSGESLNDFMSGAFKELLHTVLMENLADEVANAQKHRNVYLSQLKKELLTPLADQCLQQLSIVTKEIGGVTIEPFVPEFEETISKATISIADTAPTVLGNKGTGVRGALLVALLGYIAKHSKRSLILAVEEPESFLHPSAQQILRCEIAKLAQRRDVSLLVTTHSPFMLDRSPSTRITALAKDTDGRTYTRGRIQGDSPHAQVTDCLFGETITPHVLDAVQPLVDGVKAVVFVEGYTDKRYMEFAVELAGRKDLLAGVEIRSDEGAHKAAIQAILLRQMVGATFPIVVLFDYDEPGKQAMSLLKDKFNWKGQHVLNYRKWRMQEPSTVPVEAEDMFPANLIEAFLQSHPDSVLAEKMQFKDGTFHYGFTQDGKDAFLAFLKPSLCAAHVPLWIKVIEYIRQQSGIDNVTQLQVTQAPMSMSPASNMVHVPGNAKMPSVPTAVPPVSVFAATPPVVQDGRPENMDTV